MNRLKAKIVEGEHENVNEGQWCDLKCDSRMKFPRRYHGEDFVTVRRKGANRNLEIGKIKSLNESVSKEEVR